jgi:short-subunit dehydrogenase
VASTDGTVLLLGGRSEIGLELVERLISNGVRHVCLAARRSAELDDEEARLRAAGATSVTRAEFDADDLAGHEQLLTEALGVQPAVSVVVLAFGVLGDQARAETDAAHALAVVSVDYLAQVSVLTHVARLLRAQGSGLDGFASGLADALHGSGVHLLLVRPGFVVGRMTEGMTPAPLSSTPAQVADAVAEALDRGRDVVWVPRTLRPVFAVLRLLPRAVWRRMPR